MANGGATARPDFELEAKKVVTNCVLLACPRILFRYFFSFDTGFRLWLDESNYAVSAVAQFFNVSAIKTAAVGTAAKSSSSQSEQLTLVLVKMCGPQHITKRNNMKHDEANDIQDLADRI